MPPSQSTLAEPSEVAAPGAAARRQLRLAPPPASPRFDASPAAASTVASAAVKRGLDIVISVTCLALTLPLLAIVAVAVKLESPGPVFYRARRVGRHGRPMGMLKFRKMHEDAAGLPITSDGDHRFTRIGLVLAKTKLDELPQLWNVLRGEMSLIGPRPEDPHFVALHADKYEQILAVRPGITGLSQLAFAEESRILDVEDPVALYLTRILPQKMGLDRLYAARMRTTLDLRILFWTAMAVIARKQVAVHRATGAMNIRRRRAVDSPPPPPAVAPPLELAQPRRLRPQLTRRRASHRAQRHAHRA
jgi:lipopolysaccharide/colanic/teichoic acid biosynthesis glycosyltransferase